MKTDQPHQGERRGRELLSGISIRTQMLVAALLTLLPMMALAVYQVHGETVQARRNVEQVATSIARLNAGEISRILQVTEVFLEKMSEKPDIRALDASRCGHWFDHFPDIYPHHSNLLTKDLAGNPVCSALPIPSGAKINLMYYLDEVRHANGFAIGTPIRGPLSKRWVVPLDFPIRDGTGIIIGTVSAPLDLLNFNPFVGSGAFDGLPEGTTATLFAPDMTMLARSLEPEKWIGSKRVLVPELTGLVAKRSGTTRFVSMIDHIERIHVAAPVPGTAWTTIASIPTAPFDTAVAAVIRQWVWICALVSLASMAVAYALARRTAKPILAVAAIAERVGGGEMELRAPSTGSSEVVKFAAAFNDMLDSLRDKNREMERFTDILAHHLQEPVRLQMNYASLLKKVLGKDRLAPEVDLALGYVMRGAERLRLLLRDVQLYLELSLSPPASCPCDAGKALAAALVRLERKIVATKAEIRPGDLPMVMTDPDRLVEVFAALIDNSLSYGRNGVPPVVGISAVWQGHNVVIAVADNGIGIPEEFRERVFDVFERLHPGTDQSGTGIGLALARKIIEASAGKVWIETVETDGTRVLFSLPGYEDRGHG